MTRPHIALRREDKNPWERRVALTPDAVKRLIEAGVAVDVESFPRRAFADEAYAAAGATVVDDVRDVPLILGIKEIPTDWFRPGGWAGRLLPPGASA